MRYLALACDYDGTIAREGKVDQFTVASLERLRATGRKLILVTGRQLEDLLDIFADASIFEIIVAENGAVLYWPATREEQILGEPPPASFIRALEERGVDPLAVGRVIVATWHPYETQVVAAIRDLGLELQVIFNKGAVMVLPSGINKATGMHAALNRLGLSPHNVVGVGDAENDHAFLRLCECSVAVANALLTLKEAVDWVTTGADGAGVRELIDEMISSDLAEVNPHLRRHHVLLGKRLDDSDICLEPYGKNLLLAGTSGGGKTTLALGVMERLMRKGYQVCVIDPEGDYAQVEGTVLLGDATRAPNPSEVLQLLEKPDQNVVVNLLGISMEHRPAFFEQLVPRLLQLRAHKGHPHWIAIDETHHLLPSSREKAAQLIPQETYGLMMITVHPHHVVRGALALVDIMIAVGDSPADTLREFSEALAVEPPQLPAHTLQKGEAIVWPTRNGTDPVWMRVVPPRTERQRHHRKYAEGELGIDRSFYFRGPEGKLNLRAQNLVVFMQMAEGVDDETWHHHLQNGDYERWFRENIKDPELADEIAPIARRKDMSAKESRALIKNAIERRYTAPA